MFIFFVFLAIYLLETLQPTMLAGLAFGMALNIKAAPLMFLPAIVLFLWPRADRVLRFAAATGSIFLLGSLPYILQDPIMVGKIVFGYNSIYGHWGWSMLIAALYPEPPRFLHPPYDVAGIHWYFATVGKWAMLGLVLFMSFRMNSANRKLPLFHQLGLITAIFLAFTPGFGTQYLVWLVPFVLSLGLRVMAIYYVVAGLYLLVDYCCGGNRFLPYTTEAVVLLSLASWCAVIFVLRVYLRINRELPYEDAETASGGQSTKVG